MNRCRASSAPFLILALGLATGLNVGCHSVRPRTSATAEVGTTNHPLFAMSAIDVHTHTFNAHFLPLEHIVLGRRDAAPPLSWLLGDQAARDIARVVNKETSTRESQQRRPTLAELSRDLRTNGVAPSPEELLRSPGAGMVRQLLDAQATNRPPDTTRSMRGGPEPTRPRLTLHQRLWRNLLRRVIGHTRSDPDYGLATVGAFLDRMTTPDYALAARFREDHRASNLVMISHMQDMGPTYDQAPDPVQLRDFESSLIRAMSRQQAAEHGGLAYFVAYNPYRDHWPTNAPGHALEIVRHAVETQRAFGVKVYPPSGYRPIGNEIPRRPFALFTAEPGRQWEARYTRDGVRLTGAELDARLLDLLRWCTTNGIPVFAHCNTGEFQARSGYGPKMADPRWWREFLERHPDLSELRLCLGHAGGPGYWFDDRPTTGSPAVRPRPHGGDWLSALPPRLPAAWATNVVYLCTHYPNIYCETGILDEFLGEDGPAARHDFVARLREIDAADRRDPNRYPFRTKILYGSDWFMPLSSVRDRADYLRAYRETLIRLGDEAYIRFFLGNALDFLDVDHRIGSRRFPVDPGVAERFTELRRECQERLNAIR